jgi:hypothetical protein
MRLTCEFREWSNCGMIVTGENTVWSKDGIILTGETEYGAMVE